MKMSIFSLIMSIIKAINDVIIKRSDIITTVVQYQLQYSVIPILTWSDYRSITKDSTCTCIWKYEAVIKCSWTAGVWKHWANYQDILTYFHHFCPAPHILWISIYQTLNRFIRQCPAWLAVSTPMLDVFNLLIARDPASGISAFSDHSQKRLLMVLESLSLNPGICKRV